MFKILEETTDIEKAQDALNTLVFEEQCIPEAIELSLQHSNNYFEPRELLDVVAEKRLPTIYTQHDCTIDFPEVLTTWTGDFREGTNEIYEIVQNETHPKKQEIREYQQEMRNKLPEKIPLVRGVDNKNPEKHPLTSWTAKAGVAQIYGDYILYTTAKPEDVFMCSIHGEKIGEQEYVLTDYTIEEIYVSSLESQIEIYQRMQEELSI